MELENVIAGVIALMIIFAFPFYCVVIKGKKACEIDGRYTLAYIIFMYLLVVIALKLTK